jgi:hypothetical protein
MKTRGVFIDMTDTQINEKGARDYIRAARILTDHGGNSPPMGPINHNRGLAAEIAFKLCLEKRGVANPSIHDLVALHGMCPDVQLSEKQLADLDLLNAEYYGPRNLRFPSRYRSSNTRAFVSPGQDSVESLLETILSQQNP